MTSYIDTNTMNDDTLPCPYCSNDWHLVYHYGGLCPRIAAIEYHLNGTVKRVEFYDSSGRIAGLHPGMMVAGDDFNNYMSIETERGEYGDGRNNV